MKPRTRTQKIVPPGFTIRLALADRPLLKELAEIYHLRSLNQLVGLAVSEILDLCESPNLRLRAGSLLKPPRGDIEFRNWALLAQEDVRRSLTKVQTIQVKITVPLAWRKLVGAYSRKLRWAEGQVILEALQAFGVLASAVRPLCELPDIIALHRGRKLLSEEIASRKISYLEDLNLQLALERQRTEINPGEWREFDPGNNS